MRRWPTEEQLERYYSRLEQYAKPLKAEEFFPDWNEMIEQLRLRFGDNEEYKEFFATSSEQHKAMCAVGVPLYRIWRAIEEAKLYNEPWSRVDVFYKKCPLLSPKEIYECLVGLCEENISLILHHFESVGYDCRLSIIDAIYHEKKRRFCRLIKEFFSPDDLILLSDICWNSKLAETSGFGYLGDSSYVLTGKGRGKKRPIVESSYSSVDAVRSFHGGVSLGYRALWEDLYKYPYLEEPYRKELLTEREKHIITEVMSRPEAAFYERENRAFEEYCRQIEHEARLKEQSSEEKHIHDEKPILVNTQSEPFLLPENLFSPGSKDPIDQKNPNAHFIPDFDIQKQGGTKFAELINTISSFGYIAPTFRSKQLLTYVLTGRFKPEDYQEGEKVEWLDPGNGYELLYVIKYIIGNEKGKFEKARNLFNGPQWLGKGDFKDQADYAKADFRKALHAIYPDECKVKGHVDKV